MTTSCSGKLDRSNHFTTTTIAPDTYIETFVVFKMGAFGSDLYSTYITDSLNFSVYVGTYDPKKNFFNYKVSNDLIVVKNYRYYSKKKNEPICSVNLNIKELVKLDNYEEDITLDIGICQFP